MDVSITNDLFREHTQKEPRAEVFTPIGLPRLRVAEHATAPNGLHTSFAKRIINAFFAALALICLLPLLLLVALLIKLESRGPVFYYSYRVGAGYRVFKFWKFRSMRQDADQLLASLKEKNQYQAASEPDASAAAVCPRCRAGGAPCQQLVDGKGRLICESQYKLTKQAAGGAAFVKIVRDPRVTRIGRFIRNTSIDELPQLYNVLRGDMALVGNRPLPLYEAEKLTTDEFARRFLAPAGITGLWQVSKRGQGGHMSEEERIRLDVEYARTHSFKKDLQIVWKTLPALFQKESV